MNEPHTVLMDSRDGYTLVSIHISYHGAFGVRLACPQHTINTRLAAQTSSQLRLACLPHKVLWSLSPAHHPRVHHLSVPLTSILSPYRYTHAMPDGHTTPRPHTPITPYSGADTAAVHELLVMMKSTLGTL